MTAPLNEAVVFANELLDAFPVHRVMMREGQLVELCVGCDEAGKFVWIETAPTTPRLAEYFQKLRLALPEGHVAEINLEAIDWIARAASAFRRGFLITIDYGAEAVELYTASVRRAGTLRAFHRHQFADDILARPGEQDLTTTVDWTSLRSAGTEAGLQTMLCERQDKFLLRSGLLEQMELLAANARSETQAALLRASARDMILPDSMSASFHVLIQKAATGVNCQPMP
jgi:SAM-dependent MidA family methyltransferase